jgi:hypothetical protein
LSCFSSFKFLKEKHNDNDNGNDDPNIGPDIAGVYDQAGYDAADNYNLDPEDQNHNQPTFDDGYPSLQEPLHYPNVMHVPPALQQPQMTGVHEDLATAAEIMAEDDNQPAGMPILYADNNHDGLAGVYQVPPNDDNADPAPDAAKMEERYGPRMGQYNLQPRKPRQYSHLHTVISGLHRSCSCGENKINTTARKPCDYGHMSTAALKHTVMTQHGLKKGLKEFGEASVKAVLKELKQLHNQQVIEAVKPTTLTQEQKRAALHYLMFLKRKRCGKIKGRGCADSHKQRLYTAKEEASSPTVAIESVMLSCSIDAAENCNVAILDISGAFMHADMYDEVYMILEGKMAELLVSNRDK